MSFLYRIPLFYFNIDDPKEIEENRELIINAIRLSSSEFAEKIQNQQFEKLDLKARITLRKYLIRGRFRPTPFGNFAAVGIGNWEKNFNLTLPINTFKIIPVNTNPQNSNQHQEKFYQVIPEIQKKQKHYHALVFDQQNQMWTVISLKENKILEILLKKAQDTSISFPIFQQLLKPENTSISKSEIKNLWRRILDTGILVPKRIDQFQKKGIDQVASNSLEINIKVKEQLQEFLDKAGSLFGKEESTYLVDFKAWFTDLFEDRFVSLHDLLMNSEFKTRTFHQTNQSPPTNTNTSPTLFSIKNTPTDLKNLFPEKPLNKDIYDIQLLYRLDPTGNPVIENLVCNRPFVYTGRFNRENQINKISKRIKNRIYTTEDSIYAHINIHEKSSINHICDVQNIFDFEFTPFQPIADNQLDFKDCYLGIQGERVILFHWPSNKPIIPVVLHPLNGTHITHPLMRLLWEIAHQDRFRFLPYQNNILSEKSGCPQLNWEKLCLQSMRWKISLDSVRTMEGLKKKLKDLELPDYFLAGNQDLELLLNKNNQDDILILYRELQRDKSLVLSQPLWLNPNHFQSQQRNIYPQFVYQYSRTKPEPKLDFNFLFNPIEKKYSNCLCFTIQTGREEIPEVIDQLFTYLKKKIIAKHIPSWYFLVYGKTQHVEIRLRILNITPKKSKKLFTKLSFRFIKENWKWKMTTYYPESRKYGSTGLETSHHLFHIESDFLSTSTKGIPNMDLPTTKKENLIVKLWENIFQSNQLQPQLFHELKNSVKSMDPQLVKDFRKDFQYLAKSNIDFPITNYLNLIQSHEYYSASKPQTIFFLFNHLHMMINRFFLSNSHNAEQKIRYRLYRELGKQIYRENSPKITSPG